MTQSARRATTRAALLAATIDSLLAQGVAGTSTRGVAERAGVSQGALQHHFPNKAQLVEAALSASLVTSLEQLLAPPYDASSAPARAAELLDRLWHFHRLPLFGAVFEMLALAQQDPVTAERTAGTLDALLARIEDAAAAVLPDDPTRRTRIRLAVAAVRGAAAVETIPGAGGSDWDLIRRGLIDVLIGEAR
ncbi:TetR/AcrR family transcriptional regulator [Nocardioides limicola]|uniref:TetR/AcrR family transcriptional regulator n=1 Tax=Nocardioides limicola TaxID=2803368 RepID=UPI001EEFC2CB|nr:TetR/AcrR family transcriptional regulator [Nocardioides sp. DJM-14]